LLVASSLRRLLAAFLVVTAAWVKAGSAELPASGELADNLQQFHIRRADVEAWTPVSLTPVAPGRFVVANYRNLYLIDERQKTITPLAPPAGISVWAPTAVQFAERYGLLFVANYTGNDILMLRLVQSGGELSLQLVERVVDEIEGAEGVFVSPDSSQMAVANYVGQNIALYERRDGRWHFRWKQSLVSAHGVAIVGRSVYGAGVALAKFDLADGRELLRKAALGPHPIQFATCVTPTVAGNLLVSDPEAGSVYLADQQLNLLESVGENGPTYANLDMPYCAYQYGERTFVLSTYQARIVVFDHADGNTSSWLSSRDWQYLADGAPSGAEQPGPSIDAGRPVVAVFGFRVRPGYGVLQRVDRNGALLLPTRGVLSDRWPYYAATAAEDGETLVIVANSSPVAIVYDRTSDAAGLVRLDEWDCWGLADRIACPMRMHGVSDLRHRAEMIELSEGAVSVAAIAARLHREPPAVRAEFSSDPGRRLLEELDRACSTSEIVAAATQYQIAAADLAVPFVEYWLSVEMRALRGNIELPCGAR
jgi:hypothetical protein